MNLSPKFIAILLLSLVFAGCKQQSSTTASAQEMTYERVNNAVFKAKMAEKNTIILDVRTPAETDQGIIKGAQLIDFKHPSFKEEISKLEKDKTYLIYCRSGGRSARAAALMQDLGFSSIYELETGYSGWKE